MYIFQPERILLREQVMRYAHYMKGTVLDVGSDGGGRYAGLFPCEKYISMDIDSADGVDLVGRAENIPLENDSIDSVLCTQVFEHLEHPFEASREIARVLKVGGHLLLTVPQMNELHEEPHDYFRYTKFGIESMFKKAGFSVVTYEQRGGFFTTRAQILIRYCIDRFHLYQKPMIGKIFGKFLLVYGKCMMWLDTLDTSTENRKHTLGWCFVFKKDR